MMNRQLEIPEAAFLDARAKELEGRVIEGHKEFFDSYGEVVSLAYQLFQGLRIDSHDLILLYAGTLFARLIETTQSVALLAARGFSHSGDVHLRISLEALIRLKAACTKPALALEIINSDLLEQKKIAKLVLKGEAGELTEENRPEIEARLAELEKLIKENKVRKVSVEEVARKVEAIGLYQNIYRHTSGSVHLTPRSLYDHLRIGEAGRVSHLVHGPRDTHTEIHLHAATEFLLIGMSLMAERLKVDLPEGFSAAGERFRKLSPRWPGE